MTVEVAETVEELQKLQQLLRDKRAHYLERQVIVTGAGAEFEIETELARIADQLATINGKIADLRQRELGQDIYQALLLLNYDRHIIGFSQLARKEKVAAVLVYGPAEHGQRWLVNRMLKFTVKGKLRKFRFDLTQLAVASGAGGVRRQLSAEFGLDRNSTFDQIAERICACRETQHVIFFIDCLLDVMPERGLADFLHDFWQPLAEVACGKGPAENYLMLILVDQSGCKRPQPLQFLEGYAGSAPFDPAGVVRLPALTCFADRELEAWMNMAPVIQYLPDLQDRIAVAKVLDKSDNGVPERALDEICYAYGFDWLMGVKQWLTLY